MTGYHDAAAVAARGHVRRPLGEGLVVAGCLRGLAESGAAPARRIPIIGCAQAGELRAPTRLVARAWHQALRRRSQKARRLTWTMRLSACAFSDLVSPHRPESTAKWL